jgi:hypothetical protein
VNADQYLQELLDNDTEQHGFMTAQVLAYRGDIHAAFDWLAVAIKNDNWRVSDLHNSTMFRNLHSDPGWGILMNKLGHSPEQLAAIKFEVVLPE